jgi:restriction system protein
MWMVRNPAGQHADDLLKKNVVGIGWGEVADLAKAKVPEDYYAAVRKSHPEDHPQAVINAGRQLYKFFQEMKVGDVVATYDSPRRMYHVGVITGDAQINPEATTDYLNCTRTVDWKHQVERDQLSQAARNSFGSTLTIFRPSEEAEAEIWKLINEPKATPEPESVPTSETETEDPLTYAKENSRELIKDKLIKLTWQDMQALVAGILRAMGYKTKISPEGGGDRGKDIIASPDALQLEHPRIFVEVKHRKGQQMGAPDIRRFVGGRDHANDRCVFVSTGGFSTEAKYEAERSRVALTLVDSDELVELLVEYYEKTDAETRTLVPLRKTYWPA